MGLFLWLVWFVTVYLQPMTYQRSQEGWTAWIPTTALIIAMKWDVHEGTLSDTVLRSRADEFSAWQIRMLGAWVAPLNREHVKACFHVPVVWPNNRPVPIMFKPDYIYRQPADDFNIGLYAVRITATSTSTRDSIAINQYGSWDNTFRGEIALPPADWHLLFPSDAKGICENTVCVHLESVWARHGFDSAEPQCRREAVYDLQFQTYIYDPDDPASEAMLHDVKKPYSRKDSQAIIQRSVRFTLSIDGAPARFLRPHVQWHRWYDHKEVTLVFDLDVLDHDDVIFHQVCGHDSVLPGPETRNETAPLIERITDHTRKTITPGNLQVRIRSRSDLAVFDPLLSSYWDGEIILPLADLIDVGDSGYTLVRDDDFD
jgi:hypothetical protein